MLINSLLRKGKGHFQLHLKLLRYYNDNNGIEWTSWKRAATLPEKNQFPINVR